MKAKKNLTQWNSYISTSLKKSVEATLESAERIQAFKDEVGEEEFKYSMKDWYGFSASHLSYWNKIAENMDRFTSCMESLPASTRTLYELSSIDDSLWVELVESKEINPSLTVEAAKNLKLSGGVVKKLAAKYSESYNFLDISRKLNELRTKFKDIVELKAEFNKWLKINPPEYPEDKDEQAIDGEYEEVEDDDDEDESEPVKQGKPIEPEKMTRQEAFALYGIHMDRKCLNLEVVRLLHKLADEEDTEELYEAIRVITDE